MQVGGVPSLGIKGERCPFTWVHVRNRDIREIKDPRAHIVAGWLCGVYGGNRNQGQNKKKTHLRFHMFSLSDPKLSIQKETRVEGRVSRGNSASPRHSSLDSITCRRRNSDPSSVVVAAELFLPLLQS